MTVGLMIAAATARGAEMREMMVVAPEVGTILYGLSIPDGYARGTPRPLILALHPGGARTRYYGSAYAQLVVAPAASKLGAIIVAPDCPWPSWTDATAERAVLLLIDQVMAEYDVDRKRVLVTGFSMGGTGTWFMSARHPDVFTAAIPMAASTAEPLQSLATMPTYVIHSRADQVVAFAPAARNVRELELLGRTVKFDALTEPEHFDMREYIPALRRGISWITSRWPS